MADLSDFEDWWEGQEWFTTDVVLEGEGDHWQYVFYDDEGKEVGRFDMGDLEDPEDYASLFDIYDWLEANYEVELDIDYQKAA